MCQLRTRDLFRVPGVGSLRIGFTAQSIKYNWLPFIVVLWVSGILGSRSALAELKTTTNLTVLLFNRSHASADTLTRTKNETANIFSRSGIRLVWADCPSPPRLAGAPGCKNESAPDEIRVRILDRQFTNYLPDDAFGFAIPPVWATVYYDPALRLARSATDSESNVSIILSCLIAHEIGHLLLGHQAHAVDGIMRARWEVWQIQQAMKGVLRFLPEQEKVMMRNAQARTSVVGTLLSAESATR